MGYGVFDIPGEPDVYYLIEQKDIIRLVNYIGRFDGYQKIGPTDFIFERRIVDAPEQPASAHTTKGDEKPL